MNGTIMKLIKKLYFLVALMCYAQFAYAQVPKKTIVEHFTNTKCGICASRNPGFNTNLNANPQILRISIHPSAPYSTCFLSQQNTSDNDARTNYYGVYGSTPKLVINGTLIPTSQNYADAAMFTPFVASSNFTIEIKQFAIGSDSIQSVITIKRIAPGVPVGNAALFAGLVEDTVFGNGGNGENLHFNVFRKSLFSPTGQVIALPNNVGDSLTLSKTENFNPIWNTSSMRTLAILQDEGTRQVIQSELSSTEQIGAPTKVNKLTENSDISIFPNPSGYFVTIKLSENETREFVLYNSLGLIVDQGNISNQKRIDVSGYNDGIYLIKIFNECGSHFQKLVVRH
jgi:hypothetical protein